MSSSTTEEKIDEIINDYKEHAGWARLESSDPTRTRNEETLKQALLSLIAEERLDELSELWTSGTSKFADIRTGFNKSKDIYERRAELKALSTKQGE